MKSFTRPTIFALFSVLLSIGMVSLDAQRHATAAPRVNPNVNPNPNAGRQNVNPNFDANPNVNRVNPGGVVNPVVNPGVDRVNPGGVVNPVVNPGVDAVRADLLLVQLSGHYLEVARQL
ncbi:hypothetical protein JOY44_26610 (plasmid) [Phormidium sp. CLA17]|uniref:hypothetical protein n=1 Tax=Leptolyngbya sp. Cla-17 TaxID=2803751 RepID=UPI0014918F13|nr:hypothetical protein [Leptolyngbya sp. Cla-17]MBM0745092.1 hypothetical protein [Leptolyngbya sp. Cla-17]